MCTVRIIIIIIHYICIALFPVLKDALHKIRNGTKKTKKKTVALIQVLYK